MSNPGQLSDAHGFVGKREWGPFPSGDKPCQACGIRKDAHHMVANRCKGVLNLGGQHYPCTVSAPHKGLACGNSTAGAIWHGPTDMENPSG